MPHEEERPEHRRRFKIRIDREQYEVDQEQMTGAELRQVPPTPIPPDRDLYLVRPGRDDLLIADDDVVDIRNGLRFFTAPGQINPGLR
jgi:molybdopterin/thiamine biosynthesis adenylyltransferase